MKSYRHFCCFVITTAGVLLALFAVIIFLVDPFFHYHTPWFGMLPVFNNEGYQNAGIAQHFNYDSVITGSSMSENFKVSQFQEEFGINPIKMTFSGGRTKAFSLLLEQVFEQREPKMIFMDLHLLALKGDAQDTYLELPDYLYNANPFDDVNYLLNKKVMSDYVYSFLSRQKDLSAKTVYDEAYSWYGSATFSREWVLSHYNRVAVNDSLKSPTLFEDNCRQNLSNLIPFFEEHPNTTFYCFIPPYSMLFWDEAIRSGEAEAYFSMIEQIAETILPYKNVKLFYFQDLTDYTSNLENYRDYGHYHPDMNEYICKSMALGNHEITLENLSRVLDCMRSYVSAFDYDAFTSLSSTKQE